mmetsp:Transcript_40852/g.85844  ORF Transcript_40852/g.85844 Transcript_40852/m.85844 type:complete len:236 (-) Transcript_40852:275-982(-)
MVSKATRVFTMIHFGTTPFPVNSLSLSPTQSPDHSSALLVYAPSQLLYRSLYPVHKIAKQQDGSYYFHSYFVRISSLSSLSHSNLSSFLITKAYPVSPHKSRPRPHIAPATPPHWGPTSPPCFPRFPNIPTAAFRSNSGVISYRPRSVLMTSCTPTYSMIASCCCRAWNIADLSLPKSRPSVVPTICSPMFPESWAYTCSAYCRKPSRNDCSPINFACCSCRRRILIKHKCPRWK